MTDETIDQTATDTGRVTRRDLAEGNIGKVMTERTTMVPISDFGLKFENAFQMGEAAKLMATAGPMLPEWLQGNVGGCWGIILRATELGISPLTLANWSYLVENKGVKRVAYESQFYHAIVEARAPIKDRLQHEILGEGEERRCRVWATFKGATKETSLLSNTLAELRPGKNQYGQTKGSPLWDRKPDVQMFYDTSRDWARLHCPDILGGVYARDELEETEQRRVDNARDVSPRLAGRLNGPGGEGFAGATAPQSIDAALAAARAPPADIKPPAAAARKARQPAAAAEPSEPGPILEHDTAPAAADPAPAPADDFPGDQPIRETAP